MFQPFKCKDFIDFIIFLEDNTRSTQENLNESENEMKSTSTTSYATSYRIVRKKKTLARRLFFWGQREKRKKKYWYFPIFGTRSRKRQIQPQSRASLCNNDNHNHTGKPYEQNGQKKNYETLMAQRTEIIMATMPRAGGLVIFYGLVIF